MENKIIVRKYEEKGSSSYDPQSGMRLWKMAWHFHRKNVWMRKPARSFSQRRLIRR